MSISINGLTGMGNVAEVYQNYATNGLRNITNDYNDMVSSVSEDEVSFDTLFQSALGLINETNEYSNIAEQEELNYAMGLSEDTHTLMIAQQKANLSLQYTVAVRDAVIDAYKEIINMQF